MMTRSIKLLSMSKIIVRVKKSAWRTHLAEFHDILASRHQALVTQSSVDSAEGTPLNIEGAKPVGLIYTAA